MATATANSSVSSRVQKLENAFLKGELTLDEIKTYSIKIQDDFWWHMRRNIGNNKALNSFSKQHADIIKWLEMKRCNKKNCGCYIPDIPTSVAKGLSGPACQECKKRKIQNKINLRIQKATTQVCCKGNECSCPICFEDSEEGDCFVKLPCGHPFHADCINRWFIDNKETCPNCRFDLQLNLNVEYKKKKTYKQIHANMLRKQQEVEKMFRARKARANIKARENIVRTNGGFFYKNSKGFSYSRAGPFFLCRAIVIITCRVNTRKLYARDLWANHWV